MHNADLQMSLGQIDEVGDMIDAALKTQRFTLQRHPYHFEQASWGDGNGPNLTEHTAYKVQAAY